MPPNQWSIDNQETAENLLVACHQVLDFFFLFSSYYIALKAAKTTIIWKAFTLPHKQLLQLP